MTVLQGVLASAGLVAVLMGLIWRMFVHFDAKNEQAHAAIDDRAERRAEAHRAALEAMNGRLHAITANVQAVDDRAERRAEAHRAALEAMNGRLHAITANVQAVDDRAERRAEAHRAALEAIRARRVVPGRPAGRTRPAAERAEVSAGELGGASGRFSSRLDPRTPLWYSS